LSSSITDLRRPSKIIVPLIAHVPVNARRRKSGARSSIFARPPLPPVPSHKGRSRVLNLFRNVLGSNDGVCIVERRMEAQTLFADRTTSPPRSPSLVSGLTAPQTLAVKGVSDDSLRADLSFAAAFVPLSARADVGNRLVPDPGRTWRTASTAPPVMAPCPQGRGSFSNPPDCRSHWGAAISPWRTVLEPCDARLDPSWVSGPDAGNPTDMTCVPAVTVGLGLV